MVARLQLALVIFVVARLSKDLFVIFLVNGKFDETGKSFFSYIQCYGTRLIWNFDHGHVVEACKGSVLFELQDG
jgi:hypothetical protein